MSATPEAPPAGADNAEKTLEERVVAALKTCYDPEIPVDIYELGLVYSIDVTPENVANVKMTLTAPACPVAGSLPGEVEAKVKAVPGVSDAKVELVWDPPWRPEMMSKLARVMLGM
jgi:FeS assembly SUF system protein